MRKINSNNISVRSCSADDVEFIADYISNCSEEFLRSFGADKKKIPTKEILINNLRKNLDDRGILKSFVVVFYNGKRIGHYNVNNIIEKESAIFHGQIWDE